MADVSDWPDLPDSGFMVGRAATTEDVAIGNAAFVLSEGETTIGRPISIDIPQYAIFRDGDLAVPVIFIQAEEAKGQRVGAGRRFDGSEVVGLLSDFELLGKMRPESRP